MGNADHSETQSDSGDPDEGLVEALVAYDEALRRGETDTEAPRTQFHVPNEAVADPDAADSAACLDLLEFVFPRSKSPTATPTRIGRFEVERMLGQGGFGIVYLARDPLLGRLVALKIPRPHVLDDLPLRERFLREARAAGKLDHPHIVSVHDVGVVGGVCYISSVYCDGGTLHQWLRVQSQPVPAELAAYLVKQLATAVQHAHSRGVLHRDLKPSNILLATDIPNVGLPQTTEPQLKITDFGLAKLVESDNEATQTSVVLGTINYMAPEQLSGKNQEVGIHTDVYSLGVILFELLTGATPFAGDTPADRLRTVDAAEPPRLRRFRRDVPRDLETICRKCLAFDHRRRYATAAALADDLDRFLLRKPILASPPSVGDVVLKWMRRRPAAASLLGLLVVLVVGFGVLLAERLRERTFHTRELAESLRVAERLRAEGLERERLLRLEVYASEIQTAERDMQSGFLNRAHERLARFIPQVGETDDVRGPEWHYLWKHGKTPTPILEFSGHRDAVGESAVSPDGRTVVTGDLSGLMKVWDLQTGAERQSLQACAGQLRAVRYSADGRFFAAAGDFHFITVWETNRWDVVQRWSAHDGPVTTLDFSPDGELLASGGRDHWTRVWNWRSAERLQEFLSSEWVGEVRFRPDGRSLVQTGNDGLLKQWDVLTGREISSERLAQVGQSLGGMALSGDGRIVAARSAIGLHLIDLDAETRLQVPYSDGVLFATISPNLSGPRIATAVWRKGPADSWLDLWSIGDGSFDCLNHLRFNHQGKGVLTLAFTPDARHLITGCDDNTAQAWNVPKLPFAPRRFFRMSDAAVDTLTFSSDSRLLATGGKERVVRVSDVATGAINATFSAAKWELQQLQFSSDGLAMWACSWEPGVWKHDLTSRGPHDNVEVVAACDHTVHFSLSPTGSLAVVQQIKIGDGRRDRIVLSDPVGKHEPRTLLDNTDGITRVRFSPDGTVLAVGFHEAPLRLIDVETGQADLVSEEVNRTHWLAFHPQRDLLAVGGHGKAVRLINWRTRTIESTVQLPSIAHGTNGLSFSPDGRLLAISTGRGVGPVTSQVLLWHLELERVLLTLDPFDCMAGAVEFSPDGRHLAAAILELHPILGGGAVVWDLSTDETPNSTAGLLPPSSGGNE